MTPDELNLVVGTIIMMCVLVTVGYVGIRLARRIVDSAPFKRLLPLIGGVIVFGAWIMAAGLVLALIGGAASFWRSLF